MTVLVIGNNAPSGDLVLSLQYGAHDYQQIESNDPRWFASDGTIDRSKATAELVSLIGTAHAHALIDATGPYAEALAGAIVSASAVSGVAVMRAAPPSLRGADDSDRWRWVESIAVLREMLGSKDAGLGVTAWPWAVVAGAPEYVTILPCSEDLPLAHGSEPPERSVRRAHLVMSELEIKTLVVLDSHDVSTVAYLRAADSMGIDAIVVQRPHTDTGYPAETATTDNVLDLLRWLNRHQDAQ